MEHRVEHVAVIGGTHGNELTGAWLLERWRRQGGVVQRQSFQTHLLLGNPKAVQQAVRYVDEDLNRCFDENSVRPQHVEAAAKQRKNYEFGRAQVLRTQLETFRVIPDGVLVDMHSTTANMGITLIFVNEEPFNLKLAAWIKKRVPELRVYLWLDENVSKRAASSLVERGVTLEVGPVANGIVRGDLFWKTERTILHLLDFIEEYNQGGVLFDGEDELEVFVHVGSLDFPRDDRDRIRAFIHEDLQDRDYYPLETGAPLFQAITDGETIRYEGPSGLCPVFVNEAAYYEKRVALLLAQRQVRRV